MPIVLMHWKKERRPVAVPSSLIELLTTEAGMDSTEAANAAQDLLKGREVEACFDYGENAAAMEFARKALGVGVDATIRSDTAVENVARISRFRTWLAPGLLLAILLIRGLIQEPSYGVILSVLVVGGVTVFVIIRAFNRNV